MLHARAAGLKRVEVYAAAVQHVHRLARVAAAPPPRCSRSTRYALIQITSACSGPLPRSPRRMSEGCAAGKAGGGGGAIEAGTAAVSMREWTGCRLLRRRQSAAAPARAPAQAECCTARRLASRYQSDDGQCHIIFNLALYFHELRVMSHNQDHQMQPAAQPHTAQATTPPRRTTSPSRG